MSYLDNKHRRQRKRLIIATLLVVALAAANYVMGNAIARPVRAAGAALWSRASMAAQNIGGSGFFSRNSTLARENVQLKERLQALEDELVLYRSAAAENDELRAIAHIAKTTPGIGAPIVSSVSSSPYGTFALGAGAGQGVQKDALVLSGDGFVIGRVVDVGADTSLAREIFAPGSKVEVLVGRIPLTLSGKGGGNAIGEAPRGAAIATGTPAVAPTLRGMKVGVVGASETARAGASVDVHVRTPANLETLRFVYIAQ